MTNKLSEEKIAEIKEKAATCNNANELARICGVSVTSARKYGFPDKYIEYFKNQDKLEKEYREYCKSIGICTRCKKRLAMCGHNLCEYCTNQIEDRKKQRIKERGYNRSKQEIENSKEYENNKYKYRKEHGLCVRCGKPALPGKTTCNECRIKKNRYQKEYMDKKGKRKHWKELGLCIRCGKERKPGYMFCEECYQKQVEYGMKGISKVNREAQKTNHNQFVRAMYLDKFIKGGKI